MITSSVNIEKISIVLISTIFMVTPIHGQVHSSKQSIPFLHHEIEGFLGSTHIPKGTLDDSGATLILPNISLNYKYWVDERFAIGWYNNIVALTYVINSDTQQDLERKTPFTTSIIGVFKPWKNLSIFTGPGLEIDKNKTLFVFRFGLEYGFPLSNDWYLIPRFIFDNLGGNIQAFTVGIGASKRF